MVSKLLSSDEVESIIGDRKTRTVPYSEISQYDSIEQLFGKDDCLILLYISEIKGNTTTGHYTLLCKNKRAGKTIVEYCDSYGKLPDNPLEYFGSALKKETNQDYNYLTRLLYKFSLQPNCQVEYNEVPLQKFKNNIATCGRWCAVRGYFRKIPLTKYQAVFKKLKNNNINLDQLIVGISNYLIHNNNINA